MHKKNVTDYDRMLWIFLCSVFVIGSTALFSAAAEPGHHSHKSHQEKHTGDHHSGGHKNDASYGKSGDPNKPSRAVAIKMVETDVGMAFVPSKVYIAKGEQILFQVSNVGELEHEIVIATEEENSKHAEEMRENPEMVHNDSNAIRLKPGKNGSILWQFTNTGVFEMSCLIPGHKEAGMTGSVTVK